jgi:hypothetical protein
MIKFENNELVFSFPEVDDQAIVRIHFRRADEPNQIAQLIENPAGDGYCLATPGRLRLHLRPQYPFAVLIRMQGINALTGDEDSRGINELARPQNYFVTPPQGGIDGYLRVGKVLPFYAYADPVEDRASLTIQPFPMKAVEIAQHRRVLCGFNPKWETQFLLPGGDREIEPIYEDMCCIGDWDQTRTELATVWLHGRAG